jgi:hypothetical protein
MREFIQTRKWLRCLVPFGLLLSAAVALQAQTSDSGTSGQGRSEGLEAFAKIATVLRHPRCLNCHTTTNFPRQGDDRHPHANLVRRGAEGKGVPGQLCGTCHQSENNEASGVPGKPNWHLAPLSMGWEGLSDAELCAALKDTRKNGGRDLTTLTEHIATDPLVAYGWDPGTNRKPISISRQEVAQFMRAWARAGAPCPSPSLVDVSR